jgi:glycosyltransferase involved in cell wall biosynthesis
VKILAVHQGGGLGGAPVSLLKMLARVDPARFEVQAVFTEPGDVLGYAAELGVPARVVPTGGAFFYSAHARLGPRSLARFVRTFPSAVQRARRVLRQERPDLLHLNTSVLLAWAAAARHEHVPCVWVVREVLGPNPTLRGWHVQFITRHARRVVAISSSVAECFPREARPSLVYNAVDLADFRLDLLDEREHVRRELGLPQDAPTIMALGSVQRPKGHWLLLDALGRLDTRTRLVLVCGGAGAAYARTRRGRLKRALGLPLDTLDALLRDAHARGLREQIVVTGFRSDIPRLLTATDVLAFPSLEPEGFGRPIIEAMAMARPVVATHVGPSAEVLGPQAGLLVSPNMDSLARALAGLLGDARRSHVMGEAGRRRVEACFSLERQVAEMSAIYTEAAAASAV